MRNDRRSRPPTPPMSAIDRIEFMTRLGDMAEVDYKNALGLAAIIDVLVRKGLATPADFADAAKRLDAQLETEIRGQKPPCGPAHLRVVPAPSPASPAHAPATPADPLADALKTP